MKLLHNANNNIEWGAPISRLRQGSNRFGGVYVFPITSCWPCAPFCYSPGSVFELFLHIGLSFICLIAHSAHCAILIRCDIVKSDAIFFILFFFAHLVQWVQLLRFLFVVRLICLESVSLFWHIANLSIFIALISRLSMTDA